MTLSEFERIYKDQQYVGSGGFAQVFKTFDHAKGHYVAIKRAPVRPENKQYTLQREVDLVNKLPYHDNVARYDACYRFDMGLAGEIDFAILKFYEDGNLEQFLHSRTITQEDQRNIIRGILRGISFLHNHNYIHRDLKSQNILMQRENGVWSPKITDFGLARVVADNTVTDTSVGLSYAYASPEQIQNRKIYKNVDLWAAGVIIYRIIAGELPFRNESAGEDQNSRSQSELIRKIIQLELPAKLFSLPEPFQSMIRRCLVLDSQARTQSADELLQMMDGGQSYTPSYVGDYERTRPVPVQPPFEGNAPVTPPPAFNPAPPPAFDPAPPPPVFNPSPPPPAFDPAPPPPVFNPPPPPPVFNPAPPVVPERPAYEEEKTRFIARPDPYAPPAAPSYIPPQHDYVSPKSDPTQIIIRPITEPTPEPPAVPQFNMGEPTRGFNWWWVLIALFVVGLVVGAYVLFSKEPESVNSGRTVVQPPKAPVVVPKGNWKANYKEAVKSAATDNHADGHHNTFYRLKLAAQTAIRDRESKDMLAQMDADKVIPGIEKLTHGHQEWDVIQSALKSNNDKLLETLVLQPNKVSTNPK